MAPNLPDEQALGLAIAECRQAVLTQLATRDAVLPGLPDVMTKLRAALADPHCDNAVAREHTRLHRPDCVAGDYADLVTAALIDYYRDSEHPLFGVSPDQVAAFQRLGFAARPTPPPRPHGLLA